MNIHASIVIAALLATTASGVGHAGPYPAAGGVVERVSVVRLAQDSASGPGELEHAYKPRTGAELVVRLDDGRAIRIRPRETKIFAPGERVLVVPDPTGVRLEHADEPSSFFSLTRK